MRRLVGLDRIELELIDLKQSLNERIDEVLYDDLNKDLTIDDLEEIITYRKAIKKCYDMIDICNKGE